MTTPLTLARLLPPWMHQPSPPVAPAETPSTAVTFPNTDLVCKTYLAIGADLTQPPTSWAWTDVSDFVRASAGFSTTQGRQDWTSTVATSSGQLALSNRDGRFSRRNPNSPYYGKLTFNTPILCTVDPGSGPIPRMQMFVNEWPTRWTPDSAATDSTVPIQCAGVMRRLQQGSVLKSPMYRAVMGRNQPAPAAYWPMEDGTNATAVASGLAGGSPMTGRPKFGAAFGGSAGSLDFSQMNQLDVAGHVSLATTSGFQLEFIGQSSSGTQIFVCEVICGSFMAQVTLGASLADGQPHHMAFRFAQNISGVDVDVTIYRDGVLVTQTSLGGTLTRALDIFLPDSSIASAFLLAHMAVYDFANFSAPTTRAGAAGAWVGELATSRIRRLCAEEGVQIACTSGVSSVMGAQGIESFMNLLRECETVDQGVLYEVNWGLGYQSADDRTNQAVNLALDFNQGHIASEPQLADDDQRLRNRWTVTRNSGSAVGVVAELTSGALGTGAGGPGVYDDSKTVAVLSDSQLRDQAYWRLNLGTVDEDRWPVIPIRLQGTPGLIPSWVSAQVGVRMTVANPLTQVAPDTIDAVVEGWSEQWDNMVWEAQINTSPYSPNRVGVMALSVGDTSNPGWMDFDSVTLNTAVDTVATSWSVNASPIDAATSDDLPRRHRIAGELITVTAVSGSSAPQTWTVTRSVNGVVKAHAVGESITLDRPFVLAP